MHCPNTVPLELCFKRKRGFLPDAFFSGNKGIDQNVHMTAIWFIPAYLCPFLYVLLLHVRIQTF